MDFALANVVLEAAQEDLTEGLLGEARKGLREIGRLGIANRWGTKPEPEDDEPEIPKSSGVRLRPSKHHPNEPESPVFSKRKPRDWKLPVGEEDEPNVFSIKSVAQAKPGKKWQKVRPGKLDKPSDKPGAPTHIAFRSVLKQWREQLESSGDDTPEALGAFLHRHFGDRKWTHDKAMKVARKAHNKPLEFARKAADHYMQLSKPKDESYKIKAIWQRRRSRLGADA